MSTIRFQLINDIPECASVCVQFDDTNAPFIEDLLNVFEQFLLGMTYHRDTIKKYIDLDKIERVMYERAQAVAKLKK